MWKYIGHLSTIVVIHDISYKMFIFIFKFHDIEFFLAGLCTVSSFHVQNDTQNLVLKDNQSSKITFIFRTQIWLQ